MRKVLVEVFVPVIDAKYDVFIPRESQMSEILELLKKAVTDLSGGRFMATDETAVCYQADGSIINVNMTVYELGIHNGSKLMLI